MFQILFMLAQLIRIGEATVPGPTASVEHPCTTWGLGTINPTGIMGKSPLFDRLPNGIYAVSESHLSQRGKPRFRRELAGTKSRFKFCAGADADLLNDSITTVGGKQTGVGFMTTFPARPVTCGWNETLYHSGRIHAATFQVGSQWIGGGVIYA